MTGKTAEMKPIFEAIDEMEDVLAREHEAIAEGRVEDVVSLTEEKQRLILKINGMQEKIAERLQAKDAQALKDRLQALYQQLETNQAALESMVDAVRTIATQLERIQKKRQDNGLYGRRGRKMVTLTEEKSELNGEI